MAEDYGLLKTSPKSGDTLEDYGLLGGQKAVAGLPPVGEPAYSGIDTQTQSVLDAVKRKVYPVGEESAYVGSEEFQDVFYRYSANPEAVSPEEKKQVETAMELYPALRPLREQIFEHARPEATLKEITNEEARQSYDRYQDAVQQSVNKLQDSEFIATIPYNVRPTVKMLIAGLGKLKEFSADFFGNMANVDAEGTIPLERKLKDIFHSAKLEPLDPDNEFLEITDPSGAVVDRIPRSKGQILATNLVKGLTRVQGEAVAALIKDPGNFVLGIPEFIGSNLQLLAQSFAGTDIVMDANGDVGFRALDDKEQEQAFKELMMHPEGPVLAAALLTGTVMDVVKTNRIITTRRAVEEMQKKIDDSFAELRKKDKELTVALRRSEEGKKKAEERKTRKPVILDEAVSELDAIRNAKDGDLRSELMAMQEFSTGSKFSDVDVAKMSRGDIEYLVSNGKIPREEAGARAETPKAGPEFQKDKPAPSGEPQLFGEEAEIIQPPKSKMIVVKQEPAPKNPEAQKAADALGIDYNGQWDWLGRKLEAFTDPKFPSTIQVENLADLPAALQAKRLEFAEARLKENTIKLEQEKAEFERSQRDALNVSRETNPEIRNLMLDISNVKDRIAEQEATRLKFETIRSELSGADAKNVDAAINSIDGAVTKSWGEVKKLTDQLADMRKKNKEAPAEVEKEMADRVVDNALEVESEVISKPTVADNPEAVAEAKAERVEAVGKRQKAEEKADAIRDDTETAIQADAEKIMAETPPATGLFEGKKQFEMVKTKELDVDTKRFQDRFEEYSEESVNSIVEDVKAERFDPDNFDPIHVWRDPTEGKDFVLAGHSRLEAIKRLGQEDIPVIYRDFKTEAEAIKYATELSNRAATAPGLRADVKVFKGMRERGVGPEELKARFKKNTGYYDALSYLNPAGKIMDIVEQRTFQDFPHAEKWARTIGEARKEFPQLTNRHEQQLWDQLYPTDKNTGLFDQLTKDDVMSRIDNTVKDAFWTPELPIKLKYDPRPMTGARARHDTGPIVAKIEDLKQRRNAAVTPEEVKALTKEIEKANEALGDVLKNQMGFELGFFGTPQAYVDLWVSMDKALRETGGYLGEILKANKMAEELKPGFEGAIESMKQHHRNLNNAIFYQQVMAKQFNDLVKSPERRQLIMDILQIDQPKAYANWLKSEKGIEINPADFSKDKLNPFEQGLLEWLKAERDRVEQFKIDNELVEPRKMPPGVKYAFQWWMNEETGKPFGVEYGRFTKSLPQAKERTFNTYLEGRMAGKTPSTDNVGLLVGKDFEMAMRANAGRELYKALHDLPLGTGQTLSDVAEIAQGVIPGATESRPAMFLENWLKAKESALGDEYIRYDFPFLEKPITYKDGRGKTQTLVGPVAVHESIAPWVQAYFDKATYSNITKAMMFAKSMKLAGIFHATQLVINDMMMLRNPVGDILKARKIKYDITDPTIKLLTEEGLKIEGYEDLGFDPVKQLEFEGAGLKNKLPHYILSPIREFSKFTFHTVGNNLKVAMAYDQFLKLNERWQSKVGPELTVEQARRRAARDAVKFSDNLFSHEDWRMAMLESSRNMVKFYYSTTARSTLHAMLISPQWQKQHVEAFAKGVKSLNPVSLWHDIRNGLDTPGANLYRRYMAGIASSFVIMDMFNYTTTQSMDGEGQHLWQNPEGHKLFHIRAPFNHPDGTAAYIRPFKTAFEVPEMLVAAGKAGINTGQNVFGKEVDFDVDGLSKFTNKLNPWWAAAFATFKFNVDEYGNKIYERRGLPEKIADFALQVYEPITISQFTDAAKKHKAPIGGILSTMGFPVSKGYPGGPWNKELADFLADQRLDKEEILDVVNDKIISAMDGNDEDLTSALLIMQEQLHMGPEARKNLIMKHWNPLVQRWDNLGQMDRAMWYLHLQETGQLEEFLEAIQKDLEQ